MKSFAATMGLFATVAQAMNYNETAYTTVTVATLTTFCPEATTIVTGGQTYTATASETLTITDCPCTAVYPVKPTQYVPSGYNATKPAVVVSTISYFTTYCPEPTTLTIPGPEGPKTYPVNAPGTVTIPVAYQTTIPAPGPSAPAEAPPAVSTVPVVVVPGTGSPAKPTATGPLEANSAVKRDAGIGALFVVAIAAFFL